MSMFLHLWTLYCSCIPFHCVHSQLQEITDSFACRSKETNMPVLGSLHLQEDLSIGDSLQFPVTENLIQSVPCLLWGNRERLNKILLYRRFMVGMVACSEPASWNQLLSLFLEKNRALSMGNPWGCLQCQCLKFNKGRSCGHDEMIYSGMTK